MTRHNDITRREFLETTGAAIVVVTTASTATGQPVVQSATEGEVPRRTIRVEINGTAHRLEVDDRSTLVELLRDRLGLTGTKIGCDRGECGACTVLMNGKAVYSCSNLASKAEGSRIQTVEGLARHGELDPLQKAFVAGNAPQCGFCTSGQLMAAKALLSHTPRPTAAQVRRGLVGNLCRCGNYRAYVDAVLAASGSGSPRPSNVVPNPGISTMTTLGQPTPRVDVVARVTGTARFSGDVQLPGMLYAKVLRSPHPHARIQSIDLSKARALPGVRAILTHDSAKVVWGSGSMSGGQLYNDDVKKITKHQRLIFNNPVRFVGDPVAAVAAVNRHVAEEALQLIAVEYEVLPFTLDPEEALKPDAPQIWQEGNLSLNIRNEALPMTARRGNVEQALRASDQVIEDHYTTAFVHDAQMEPRTCVAHWEGDHLTLYTPTQGISNCRHDTARDLGLPDEKVRVVCDFMGGGFGNKNQNQDSDLIVAVLARETAAPVKLELSRKDDFIGMHGRWPTSQYYKVGVNRGGTLQAIQLRAYCGMGPYRKQGGGISGLELYDCANTESVIHPVYTNRTVSANFRGPTHAQGFFAIQSLMDDIAYRLGMDPLEFALKTMTRTAAGQEFMLEISPGQYRRTMIDGEVPYTNYTLDECIQLGARQFDWKKRWRLKPGSDPGVVKRGAGMSFMAFRSGVGRSNAVLTLDAKGAYTLFVGVTDVGGGARTTMAMIAAETLGVPLSRIAVVSGDTDRCPFSVGESGSRTTIMTGYAVVEAARNLKQQVSETGAPTGDRVLTAATSPTPMLEGRARSCFGAHFVEVEVDTALGHVRVVKYVAVHESGRIMNRATATHQIQGAVVQGIGMALHENLLYDRRGQPLTTGYYTARHLTHLDVPDIEVTFIESDDGFGPFGAKSIGEAGIILSPGAINNAIYNAIGHRMRSTPITRDALLEVLA